MKNERYEEVEEMGGIFTAVRDACGGRKPDGAGGNAEYDGFSGQ